MNPQIESALARLPPLDRRNPFVSRVACKVCGGGCIGFDSVDFNKYCSTEEFYKFGKANVAVSYYRCLDCGLIFTDFFDAWTSDDFGRFVYNSDYPKVDEEYRDIRPGYVAADMASRFRGCEQARILDYGSGAGVFVDRMREQGFQRIEPYDPFASPERPSGRFDIITCFEVIEHSTDPAGTIADMLSLLEQDGCIIFSQTLQPDDILARRGSWWYLAPRNGHASTYNEETLCVLACRHGMTFYGQEHVYAFAPDEPGEYAKTVLPAIGPSHVVVRLHAPSQLPARELCFPTRDDVWWFRIEDDGLWRFRWTGGQRILWRVRWQPVSKLTVRVPLLQEVRPGFACECHFELAGQRRAARISRGDLAAEFDVDGLSDGIVELHLPEPLPEHEADPASRRVGLSIPIGPDPIWPAG